MPKSVVLAVVMARFAFFPTCGTEFGGGISGPDDRVTNVLSTLSARPGFRWIRSGSPRVSEYGFEGISDVRLRVLPSDRPTDALPEDLFETYWACRDRSPGLPGNPNVWEVWNEPDFYFVRDSAADMAATLKAAWWGLKAAHPDAQVLMPSLAFRPGRYALELAANGLASWTDGWNAHFYGWASDYPAFLAHHQAFAAAIGCDRPLWITEIGHLAMLGVTAEDPAALGAQAAFHERTMIESWVRGVDRHLIFLLTPYAEGRSELGLTTPQGTWRPAMTSAVRVAHALQGTRPIFRIVHRPSGQDLGVVLERDSESWWTILWSPARPGDIVLPGEAVQQPLAGDLRLQPRWPRHWVEVRVGIDGDVALAPSQIREFLLTPTGNVHLHGPPERFGLTDCRWVRWSENPGPKPRILRDAREALKSVPPPHKPSPVVIRFRPDASMVPDKPSQELRVSEGPGGSGRLQFYNFSDQQRRGHWAIHPPPGWRVESEEPTRDLEVPAMSRREIRIHLRRKDAGRPEGTGPGRMTARWEDLEGAVDECSVRVVSDRVRGQVWHRWDWRRVVPSPGRAEAWQLFAGEDGVFTVEIRSPWGLNREVAIHLPLPRGLHATDTFTAGVRRLRGRGSPFVQLEMSTAGGERWRHGELLGLGSTETRMEARLGDFSPAIWGRHQTMLFPPVEKARWLSLLIQGVEGGDVLELRAPALSRRERE